MENIALIMQIAIYFAILSGLALNLYVIQAIGKGVLNIVFASFGFGLFFVAMSNIFVALQEAGIYQLEDVTLHVWWHIVTYFGFLSIIWGGYRIKNIVKTESTIGFGRKDLLVYSFLIIATLAVFIVAQPLEENFSKVLVGSFVDKFGLHHMGSFILASIAGWHLFYIKGKWGALGTSMMFVVGFLLLLGTQHFWELLTESWKVVKLEDELIELVEQFIVLPAIILFALGQWKITKFIKI